MESKQQRNANPLFFLARHQIKFLTRDLPQCARTKPSIYLQAPEQNTTINHMKATFVPFVYLPALQTKPITACDLIKVKPQHSFTLCKRQCQMTRSPCTEVSATGELYLQYILLPCSKFPLSSTSPATRNHKPILSSKSLNSYQPKRHYCLCFSAERMVMSFFSFVVETPVPGINPSNLISFSDEKWLNTFSAVLPSRSLQANSHSWINVRGKLNSQKLEYTIPPSITVELVPLHWFIQNICVIWLPCSFTHTQEATELFHWSGRRE